MKKEETAGNKKESRMAGRDRGKRILGFFLKLIYPPRCILCDALLPYRVWERRRISGAGRYPDDALLPRREWESGCCSRCADRLPRIKGPRCMKCGKPVETAEQEYCEDCLRQEHCFDCGTAPFTYTGQMRRSVYRMKFQNRRDYIEFYAAAMAQELEGRLAVWRPQVIIPVPMHESRRRSRGYNQAELLAQHLSRLTGIPSEKGILKCIRKSEAQKQLDRKARRKNLRGSFVVDAQLKGVSRVLVADDVYTTGSTIDEVSRTLKDAGVQQVFFVVLCIGKGKNTVCTAEKL